MVDDVKVKRLPAGRAIGAGDLRYWASNRMAGRSNTFGKWDHKRMQKQRSRDRKRAKEAAAADAERSAGAARAANEQWEIVKP